MPQTTPASTGTTIWQVIGLFLLLVLIFVAAHLTTKFLANRARGGVKNRHMRVLDTLFVGKDKSVMIVEVGGKILLIGVTNQSVTMLSQLDPEDLTLPEHSASQELGGVAGSVAGWLGRLKNAPADLNKARREARYGAQDRETPSDPDEFERVMKSINERKQRLENDGRRDDSQ